MDMADNLKEIFISFVDTIGVAVWVEIITESPKCTYYFGPFSNVGDAEVAKNGYVEDLEAEAATITSLAIKRCKPKDLTVFDESLDIALSNGNRKLILSGQAS